MWDRQNKLYLEVSFKLLLKTPNSLNTLFFLVLKSCSRHELLMFKMTITLENTCPLKYES